MIRLSRSVVLILVLCSTFAARALEPEAIREFEQFVEREMKKDRMTGLSVAVLEGDRLWARGFGFADIENQVPATERSSYRMASVSKPMTAVAAVRLAEQGKLDLDEEVQRYVPYFPRKSRPVTVRQLLAHLGGISHYRDYRVEGRIREPKTTREAIAIFENFDLVNEPGSAYSYSTYGYNLAGAAIEGAAGKPYAAVMQELVWDPAGMTSTRMDSPTAIIPNRVTGYRLENGDVRRSDYVDISSRFGGGGTRSTVVDMVRFARAIDEGKLLSAKSADQMWWRAVTTSGRSIGYGLGWSVEAVNGHFMVSHSGSQQEARTLLIYFPARDLAIAFASNWEEASFNRYRDYLFWSLTGEIWNPPLYAADRSDRIALLTAQRLVEAGGLYFEKHGRPATTDRREVRRAFEYVRNAVRAHDVKALEDGMHPASGEPLMIAGSWIVSKAGIGGAPLEVLARYSGQPRLDASLQKRVADLARQWQRLWTSDEQKRALDRNATDVERYRGLRIAPNYARELVNEVEASFERGDVARAGELSKLAAEIYRDDHSAAGVYGVFLALSGKEAEAETWLRRSLASNPDGYASARRLAAIARDVPDAALVRVARRIHPDFP